MTIKIKPLQWKWVSEGEWKAHDGSSVRKFAGYSIFFASSPDDHIGEYDSEQAAKEAAWRVYLRACVDNLENIATIIPTDTSVDLGMHAGHCAVTMAKAMLELMRMGVKDAGRIVKDLCAGTARPTDAEHILEAQKLLPAPLDWFEVNGTSIAIGCRKGVYFLHPDAVTYGQGADAAFPLDLWNPDLKLVADSHDLALWLEDNG